jgi:hypothetical protein
MELDTCNMNKVLDIDPENMSFTAQGGTTTDQVDRELRKYGFTYFVHATHQGPKGLGSEVCKCTEGATKCMSGAIYRRLLGLEVVLGNGEVMRTGNSSVIQPGDKHFVLQSGMPDFTSLFVASEGALGIITEETQHMFPLPVATGYMDIMFDSSMDGFQRMVQAAIEIRKRGLISTLWGTDVYCTWRSFRGMYKAQGLTLEMDEQTALRDLGHMLMLDYDSFYSEEEINIKEKALNEIITKYGGQKVEEGSNSFAYALDSVNNPLTYGKAFDDSCFFSAPRPWFYLWGVIPYTSVAEHYEYVIKRYKEVNFPTEDMYHLMIFGPDAATIAPFSFVDISSKQSIERWQNLNNLFFKDFVNIFGAVPYAIGREWRPYIFDKLDPVYKKYIMQIKKMFDPNNILNPGVSVFD